MSEISELSHIIPVVMVWLGIGILCLYKYTDYISHKPLVYKSTIKRKKDERIRTLVTAIFSNPDKNFELIRKDNIITLQLLHSSEDNIIQFLEVKRDFREADIRTDCFGHKLLKILFIVYDKKKLPFVTRVRVSHESPNSTIFFEGIEIFEYFSNRRVYYLVKEPIRGGFADILYIKPQVLRLWSKHTFCMSFEKPLIHEFGEELIPNYNREKSIKLFGEVNGIIIRSEIGWFESVLFYSLLFCSTFLGFVSILFIAYEDLTKTEIISRILFSITLSGLFSLIFTEFMAFCFLKYIKSMYEKNVSKEALEASKRNRMIRLAPIVNNLCLGVIIFLAIICCSLAYLELYWIENKDKIPLVKRYQVKIFNNQSVDETIFLIVLYSISLFLCLTLWVFIFGLLRYLFNYLTFTPNNLIIKDQMSDQIIVENEDNNEPNEAVSHSEGKSIKRTKEELRVASKRSTIEEESSQSKISTSKPKSSIGSPKSPKSGKKNAISGTDILEKEMADEKRKKLLMTKSVIHSSTKSKGFLSPEEFRVTDSND